MKKSYLYVVLCAICFASCKHTALVVPSLPLTQYEQFGKENMEFIGFKNLNRNNLFVKEYGQCLERAHIAINKQSYYMGIYSLQELATYNSDKRYVAFVDVIKQQYSYNDEIADKEGLYTAGWVIAGVTVFTLFPVYVPMICCANKNECLITLNGSYMLYIYDTKDKEVALTIPMDINIQERYDGQYLHEATNKVEVQDRYRNMLYNLWNENFIKAYDFVSKTKK